MQQLLLTFHDYSQQVPFIYFFSTPETGARMANLAMVFSSDPLLRTLIPGDENEYLQNMENQWKAAKFHTHRFCAYERKKYKGVLVVDRLSGTRNCDDPPLRSTRITLGSLSQMARNTILTLPFGTHSFSISWRSPSPLLTGLWGLVVLYGQSLAWCSST